jgi:hypothetical protein
MKRISKTLRCDLRAVKYAGLKVSYLGASHIRGAHESMECCRILGPTGSLSRDLRAFSVTAGARKCKAPNNTVPRQIMWPLTSQLQKTPSSFSRESFTARRRPNRDRPIEITVYQATAGFAPERDFSGLWNCGIT